MDAICVTEGVSVGKGEGVHVGTKVRVGGSVGDDTLEGSVDVEPCLGVKTEVGLHAAITIKVIKINDFIFISLTPCIPLSSIRPLYP